MSYSEAAYFDGYHVAHCATWEDHKRAQRKYQRAQEAARYAPEAWSTIAPSNVNNLLAKVA